MKQFKALGRQPTPSCCEVNTCMWSIHVLWIESSIVRRGQTFRTSPVKLLIRHAHLHLGTDACTHSFQRRQTLSSCHCPSTYMCISTHLDPSVPMASDSIPQPGPFFFAGDELLCESPSKYKPGGLHPVMLGHVLPRPTTCVSDTSKPAQYHILLKLGFGAFSTVWLARDVIEK